MATEHGETHLTLRIDLEADPITGSLRSPDAAGRRFSGWIGLAAALEVIRAELAQGPEPQTCVEADARVGGQRGDRRPCSGDVATCSVPGVTSGS
jgi:hypothetical protein